MGESSRERSHYVHVQEHLGLHDDPRGTGESGSQCWVVLTDEADRFGLVGVIVDGRCDAFKTDDVSVANELHESFAAWRWERNVLARANSCGCCV